MSDRAQFYIDQLDEEHKDQLCRGMLGLILFLDVVGGQLDRHLRTVEQNLEQASNTQARDDLEYAIKWIRDTDRAVLSEN